MRYLLRKERTTMICPTGWLKSFVGMVWEDDIKPRLIDLFILIIFLGMGSLFGILVLLLLVIISRIISLV